MSAIGSLNLRFSFDWGKNKASPGVVSCFDHSGICGIQISSDHSTRNNDRDLFAEFGSCFLWDAEGHARDSGILNLKTLEDGNGTEPHS